MELQAHLQKLDKHFSDINNIILTRQDPVTGLLPASTAINAHGDYTDAWVRDNVYSILGVWGLAMAYRRVDPNHGRSYMLSQSVVKLMRGLLIAMMRQSDRVETFKQTLNPSDALHAKYGTSSGLAVVGDEEWGHLQLDATSLFMLMLAQMTASGLRIVYTLDEVNFVQNLVHYISRSYCTPDYGIWERGNKTNHGDAEINCSSVGMAKAALEALSGFNLFGNVSDQSGVIHVVPSDTARSRFTLEGLLPRESNSKETDAALLSIIGYPAYAVEDTELVERTRKKIIKKLAGKYGCKRFLLDGHQSALEDDSRLYYEPSELQKFKHIESEWPLFYCYLLLDALLRGDTEDAKLWQQRLDPLFIDEDGQRLLPELYRVPADSIAAEKEQPGSQTRIPNENLPLVWAQSLYMLADMINDGVLRASDIDPLGRRERIGHLRSTPVLVSILAESDAVKKSLQDLGYVSETLAEVNPVKVFHADQLTQVQAELGKNEKLGLTGRPPLATRTLTTARLFELSGNRIIFLPYYFNPRGFYFSHDNRLLVQHFRAAVRFIADCWDQPGQPLVAFLVRSDMLAEKGREHLLTLLNDCQRSECDGVAVTTGRLAQLATTANVERIDYLNGFQFAGSLSSPAEKQQLQLEECKTKSTPLQAHEIQQLQQASDDELLAGLVSRDNPIKTAETLRMLMGRHGSSYQLQLEDQDYSLGELCERIYEISCSCHNWSVVRRMADLTAKNDSRLEDAVLDIVIHHKRLAVGRAYSEKATFSKPADNDGIVSVIRQYVGKSPAEYALTQEILLHLAHLLKSEPVLFKNIITLRSWYFVQLLVGMTGKNKVLAFGDAYEHLLTHSPSEVYGMLRDILVSFQSQIEILETQETLSASGVPSVKPVAARISDDAGADASDWWEWRKQSGMLGRLTPQFYRNIWHLLQCCNGLVIGDKYSLQSRLGAEITHDSTSGERSIALMIDGLLNGIVAPDYRQLNIELIETMATVFHENPDLNIGDDLVLDVIIGHAVKLAWQSRHSGSYNEQRGQAWEAFYLLSPNETREAFIEAIWYLITANHEQSGMPDKQVKA